MARGVLEIPTVNTAATGDPQCRRHVQRARAPCVGAVSWKPIVLDLQELAGQRLSEDLLREAVQNVRALAEPMSDVRGSAAYKREMAVEFAARALITAWQRVR